ncbi:MAG: RNA polymerase sigma factor [Planctomycetota bacterium]
MMPEKSHDDWICSAFERFHGRLYEYVRRMVGDAHGAADVVQETYLRLCREPKGNIEGRLPEWLFTVSRNCALDILRKRKRQNETSVNYDATEMLEFSDESDGGGLLKMLSTLPANQREVLYLKFQNDLSYHEISKITGHSETYIGYLIHSGMKNLRGNLAVKNSNHSGERNGAAPPDTKKKNNRLAFLN